MSPFPQCVAPDSLNRMIACTIDDQSIIGICGETKLQNETQSFTTMIQVGRFLFLCPLSSGLSQ